MINKKIENLTKKILASFDINSIEELNLFSICSLNNIILRAEKLEHGISGLLVIKDNSTYILYNKEENSRRQNFTIAHELGHYFLHRESEVYVDTTKVLYRNTDSNKGEIKKEIEANNFAASLLMPEEFINNEIEKLNKTYIEFDDIELLANKFNVSLQAMSFRLSNLGFYF